MSVDFNSMPKTEPGLGESETPMFAGVPSWERNRKRRSFGGGKSRTAPAEPVAPRNAADVPVSDSAFATAPTHSTRTIKKSGGGVAPLAIAAGIVAIGGLAAAGWYASQPHDTGVAELTPGTAAVTPPAAPPPQVATNLAPMPGEAATAPPAPTPAKAATPPPRATTRVAAAAPARARPARSDSAEDAGVNTSATLPAAPQPYSGTAVAPSAPADVAPASPPVSTAPQPVNPATPPTEAAPQVTPPAAATPPVQTPPST
jgi:hypothetical protein